MAILDRVGFLAKFKLAREEVQFDGDTVIMRELTSKERDHFEATSFVETVKDGVTTRRPVFENLRARLVALCLVDADGNRMFGDDEIDQLGEEPSSVLGQLFVVAQKLNGLAAAAVVQAEKN